MVAHLPGRPDAAGLAIPAAVENLIAIRYRFRGSLAPGWPSLGSPPLLSSEVFVARSLVVVYLKRQCAAAFLLVSGRIVGHILVTLVLIAEAVYRREGFYYRPASFGRHLKVRVLNLKIYLVALLRVRIVVVDPDAVAPLLHCSLSFRGCK